MAEQLVQINGLKVSAEDKDPSRNRFDGEQRRNPCAHGA